MTEFLVGGYGPAQDGSAQGIQRARTAPDGRLELLGLVAEVESPSWLTLGDGVVHAALEPDGELASFALGADVLRPLSRVSTGASPCHVAVDAGAAVAACYGDGSVVVHPLDASGAVLDAAQRLAGEGSGPLPAQQGPHAHHVLPLPHDRVATADLGADRIHLHRWVAGRLDRFGSVRLPPGTGPRDLVQLPDGRLAVLGEWSREVLLLEPAGESYAVAAAVPVPGDDGSSAAAGLVSAGRFLVAALRGADRVAVIDVSGAVPTAVASIDCGGHWPRHLVGDGDVIHVANQLSSTITSFRLAPDGYLASLGEPVAVPSPTCLVPIR